MRRAVAVVLLAAGVAVPAGPAASTAQGRLPRLWTYRSAGVRPTTPIHFGIDQSAFFAGPGGFSFPPGPRVAPVHWTVWTSRTAVGRGDLYLDTCQPDCARGQYVGYPGSVYADDVRSGAFRRLRVTYRRQRRWQTFQVTLSDLGWL